jgi:nucleotide-binding universal stress UspA family protein
MLNHILVPLDGSPYAEEVLKTARQVVRPRGKITLVIVIDMPEIMGYRFLQNPTGAHTQDTLLAEAIIYLEAIAAKLSAEGFETHVLAEVGSFSEVIVRIAKRRHIEAIALCAHGQCDLTRWLFGSTMNKVLNSGICPVLVVPCPMKGQEAEIAQADSTVAGSV